MFKAVSVPNWVVLIYEGQRRFNQQAVNQMITGFVRSCGDVGRTFKASSTKPNHTKDAGRHHDQRAAGAREMGIGARNYCTRASSCCLFCR